MRKTIPQTLVPEIPGSKQEILDFGNAYGDGDAWDSDFEVYGDAEGGGYSVKVR